MSIFVPNKRQRPKFIPRTSNEAKIPLMIMMIGIPGSGKSYFAKEISRKFHAIVHSSDNLRMKLFGNVYNSSNNIELFFELERRLRADLIEGNSVVYDATNINSSFRGSFLETLKTIECFKIAVCMTTSLEECIINNQKREDKVPEPEIYRMRNNMEVINNQEGFDKIIYINQYNYNELYKVVRQYGYSDNKGRT